MASYMNGFLDALPAGGRLGGSVFIHPETLEFFVGRERWNLVLGHELRVPFFLAYQYAYLRMAAEDDIPYPKVVILDNPFQQDVRSAVVESALGQFAQLSVGRADMQIIVAVGTQRSLTELKANRIMFTTQFNPDESPAD
jgi:hypothetical protein